MRGTCDINDIWPIGRPQKNLDHQLPLNTFAILKVYAYHKFVEKQTVYQSCKNVALEIIAYASSNRIPRSGLKNLISKVKSLRKRWMEARGHESRESKTEDKKTQNYIDRELFQEFNLGQKREFKRKSRPIPPSNPYPFPGILCSKRTRNFKFVG